MFFLSNFGNWKDYLGIENNALIKEYSKNEKDIYEEYVKILNSVDRNYKVALKLSSFNFNEDLYIMNKGIK